jgi:hypothetical protein
LVPYEKDPSFLMIQGGRGGIGGGMGSDDGQTVLVYRPLACLPYSVPAHHLLLRRPYAAHEFHALWNRYILRILVNNNNNNIILYNI